MTTNEQVYAMLRERGESILNEIIEWRRALHMIPELRMETPVTEAFICQTLRRFGIEEIHSGVGGHGVCAIIRGDLPGKCLAIRADCDGLPIQEETGLPFAAQNGNMHACGHDAHTAMALGAAKILMENRSRLRGTVKFIFQPYEEGDGGAKAMISSGVLESPPVHANLALHNDCSVDADYQPGDILVLNEPTSANIYAYEATFYGPGSHVCLSRQTPNPVYMACEAVTAISSLSEPGPETVNAVTVVQGGTRNNIVPDHCTICGSIRAFDTNLHETMKHQVMDILQKTAEKHSGTVKIKPTIDLMCTVNNVELYQRFCLITNALYPERGCRQLKHRSMIGEDFARYAAQIPGFYFFLHTRPEGTSYPLHHPKFDVEEQVLHKGSVAFAAFALFWQVIDAETSL